ncbi:uncharacterized protein LOC134258148, partial [Saccostrea cucullata]|uniref:uncharacterized protein LOC134258148 n=1 Tax=Saccostrea cuccullata TaxID=36930 RepID=UPI002ED07DBB
MYLVFLFLITVSLREVVGSCKRASLGNCCTGYIYNFETSKCEECSIGLTGPNCSLQCRYPSYGRLCQQQCDCTEIYCNKIVGCVSIEKGDPSKPVLIVFVVILSLILLAISVRKLWTEGFFAKWKRVVHMDTNQEVSRKSETHFYVDVLDNKNEESANTIGNGSEEGNYAEPTAINYASTSKEYMYQR